MRRDGPERTGVLVVRVWHEPGYEELRARITEAGDLSSEVETTTVVTGVDAVCDAVRTWATRWPAGAARGAGEG